MTVEIGGQTVAIITNVMGWIDKDPAELSEVAFCVTDFSESNSHSIRVHYFSHLMKIE